MYNRYVPQADGSYRRSRMEEEPKRQHTVPPKPAPEQEQEQPCQTPREEHHPPHEGQNVAGFLKQLLPKNFDTSDLIIMLLLLLLAGDCEEDRTTAMLTLVLYLFM